MCEMARFGLCLKHELFLPISVRAPMVRACVQGAAVFISTPTACQTMPVGGKVCSCDTQGPDCGVWCAGG